MEAKAELTAFLRELQQAKREAKRQYEAAKNRPVVSNGTTKDRALAEKFALQQQRTWFFSWQQLLIESERLARAILLDIPSDADSLDPDEDGAGDEDSE